MATTVFRPGDRPLLNLGLFLLTVLTTFIAFRLMFADGLGSTHPAVESLRFSLCLVAILGSHEMGHYLMARRHGVDSSLPYFIPTPPLITFGTLGAVIRLRGRIPNRNALVDIGAAGPLAGLAVAIPVLIYGTATLKIIDTPLPVPQGALGPSSLVVALDHLWTWAQQLLLGAPPAGGEPTVAVTFFGDCLLTRGLKWLLLGPLPLGKDVQENGAYLAGWFGLLVTTLNLFPIGQLDGGHLTHALFGERAVGVGRAAAGALFGLVVVYSYTWALWFIITSLVLGFRHPPVMDPGPPLTGSRKLVCWLSFLALALCLSPTPLTMVTG